MMKLIFWYLEFSGGNEDYQTWNTFNNLFAMACPSVSFVEKGHFYSKFVFVSGSNKGLDKLLAEIFPNNHSTNCVHHIKQNVKSRFGAKAVEMVFPIAHGFSMIQEETLLELLEAKSVNAYEYSEKIPLEHWHNTQWIIT